MSSVLKNQILKPLSRFVKNLSPDKIKLSVFRGEGDLTNLELDEDALMELLDLPTWLCIRKVTCNKVSIKIQWTKLKSHPIIVFLDEVHVEVEALEEPRKPKTSNLPSYRLNEGKYGLIDRVLDGMKVIINSVRVFFRALTFRASICLDRLTVASRLPNWGDGDLKYTFVRDASIDQILLFKEICWETTRLEADGVRDLQLTPVKLITNACRVRITLKKRLSDSSVLSSRVQFVLDELLWVLTVSQLEAAVIFMKSLKKSILRSVEQSKSRAAETGSVTNQKSHPANMNHTNDSRYQQQAEQASRSVSNAARLFDVYDVPETSYHVSVGRLELHFCEENRPDLVLSNNCVRNGSIRVVFQRVVLEFYPFHLSSTGRGKWRDYEKLNMRRQAWLQETPTHSMLEKNRASFSVQSSEPRDGNGNGTRVYLMESAVLLRVADLEVTCVSTMKKRQTEPFAASDKRLWQLSDDTNTVLLCYTNYYRSDGSVDDVPLPDLFCQLNPLHLRLDFDTVTWLNAFYLNVSKNLSEWSDVIPTMGPASSPTSSPNTTQSPDPLLKLFFFLEAKIPRIIIPAEIHVSGQPERPQSLQIQASKLVISNVNPDTPGLSSALSSHSDALRFYPQQQADVPVLWEDFQNLLENRIFPLNHVSEATQSSVPCVMFCVKLESFMVEYCGARTPRGMGRPQPCVEEVPVTLWTSVRPSVESGSSYSVSVLADAGEGPLTVRLHHYQFLHLLRLSDSLLRLLEGLGQDYAFVLGRPAAQHSLSLAVHLPLAVLLCSLPALPDPLSPCAPPPAPEPERKRPSPEPVPEPAPPPSVSFPSPAPSPLPHPAPKTFASAFHRLGSSLNRFGDAVKATVGNSTPHSPAGTDEDGWERLSLGGSEFSDSDEEAKVARLMMQLDPANFPREQHTAGVSAWDHQQQLASSMTTAALEAAEAAGNDVDEEAEDVLELESVLSSSVMSVSRRDHSTVSLLLHRLHCYGSLASLGSVLAGHIDSLSVEESGARDRDEEEEEEEADGPLMHFRVDIATDTVWSRVRVLRPWTLALLMSTVTNLAELVEDEIEAPPLPFTCVLEGGMEVVLREDRVCNNLTCPAQHPEMRVVLPAGVWLERGKDQTIRLNVRQPLQMQARASENNVRKRAPSSPVLTNAAVQTDSPDTPGHSPSAGHAPSQELLTLYYTENRKLREKMSRLSRSAAETAAALEEARVELATMRQERESLYTTLDCLQAELHACGPERRPTMR